MPSPHILAALTLSLSNFSGAQGHPRPAGGTSLDLQTTGTAALNLTQRRSTFSLSYSPSLGLVDATRDNDVTLMHGAQAGYSWRARRLTLSLGVGAAFGSQSYLAAGGLGVVGDPAALPDPDAQPAPGAQPDPVSPAEPTEGTSSGYLPREQVVSTGSLTASLGLTYTFSRRWTGAIGVGFSVSGGVGDSEDVLPRQYGPNGSVSAAYLLTRRDTLTTSTSSSYSRVPSLKSRYVTTTLLETWGHAISAQTQTVLGAGVTHLRSRVGSRAEYEDSFVGAGTAGISNTRPLEGGATLTLNAGASLTTPYNPVLGVVQQQLAEAVAATWQLDRTTLSLTAGASQSLPLNSPTAARAINVGATGSYALSDHVFFSLGGGWSTQLLPGSELEDVPPQWVAFCGIGLAAPPLVIW